MTAYNDPAATFPLLLARRARQQAARPFAEDFRRTLRALISRTYRDGGNPPSAITFRNDALVAYALARMVPSTYLPVDVRALKPPALRSSLAFSRPNPALRCRARGPGHGELGRGARPPFAFACKGPLRCWDTMAALPAASAWHLVREQHAAQADDLKPIVAKPARALSECPRSARPDLVVAST